MDQDGALQVAVDNICRSRRSENGILRHLPFWDDWEGFTTHDAEPNAKIQHRLLRLTTKTIKNGKGSPADCAPSGESVELDTLEN
jgi:hypothetical protein